MDESIIDLRSDTVTRPTPAMRLAMAQAPVGDDVFGEDPSVRALEERIAAMLGKEAAVYVPSGTMSNQIAVRVHCRPGDELICEAGAHIYNYEQAGYAQLAGVGARTVEGRGGVLTRSQLGPLVRGGNDHLPSTRLVWLENTHNRGAGKVLPYEGVEEIANWAREQGLATHLDGARLFNAVVASGIEASRWARHFDTVSVCFSKGLGAPVGSALVGSAQLIRQARRHRKVLGGGMRQAGIIAAAALHALEHHVERLKDDHDNASLLADFIRAIEALQLEPDPVDTNMVIFRVDPSLGTAAQFAGRLERQGLRVLAIGPQSIRAVTHLDVDCQAIVQAGEILRAVAAEPVEGGAAVNTVY